MKRFQIIAIGQDLYWLEVMKKADGAILAVEKILCFNNIKDILADTRSLVHDTLLIIDAFGRPNIKTAVQRVRKLGWQYIVVVSADPSAKEAITVLRDAGGYDYWVKTYCIPDICTNIEKCLEEIAMAHSG